MFSFLEVPGDGLCVFTAALAAKTGGISPDAQVWMFVEDVVYMIRSHLKTELPGLAVTYEQWLNDGGERDQVQVYHPKKCMVTANAELYLRLLGTKPMGCAMTIWADLDYVGWGIATVLGATLKAYDTDGAYRGAWKPLRLEAGVELGADIVIQRNESHNHYDALFPYDKDVNFSPYPPILMRGPHFTCCFKGCNMYAGGEYSQEVCNDCKVHKSFRGLPAIHVPVYCEAHTMHKHHTMRNQRPTFEEFIPTIPVPPTTTTQPPSPPAVPTPLAPTPFPLTQPAPGVPTPSEIPPTRHRDRPPSPACQIMVPSVTPTKKKPAARKKKN